MTFHRAQKISSQPRSLYDGVLGTFLKAKRSKPNAKWGISEKSIKADQKPSKWTDKSLPTFTHLAATVSALDSGSQFLHLVSSTFLRTRNPLCYSNILPIHFPNTQDNHLHRRPLLMPWLLLLYPPQYPHHFAPRLLPSKLL